MAGCRAVRVPTDERYQLDLDAIRARDHAAHARDRHHLAEQPERRRASAKPSLRAVNALCRERGLYHISRRGLRVLHLRDGAPRVAGLVRRRRARTRSRSTRCRRRTGSPAGASATWCIPRRWRRAMMKSQDTILICPPVASQVAAVAAMRGRPRRTASRTCSELADDSRRRRSPSCRRSRRSHACRRPTARSTACCA